MGALFHRERTGEATTVDVSLFGVGLWAQSMAVCMSQISGMPWNTTGTGTVARNPLARVYVSSDGEQLSFSCLQTDPYWAPLCELVGRPDLAPRPPVRRLRGAHWPTGTRPARRWPRAFAGHTAAEWRERLAPFRGQWCVVQDSLAAGVDPQVEANGYIREVENAAGVRFPLTTAPVQYDGEPAPPGRAPGVQRARRRDPRRAGPRRRGRARPARAGRGRLTRPRAVDARRDPPSRPPVAHRRAGQVVGSAV